MGNIEITKVDPGNFIYDIEFEYKEKPKQQNGITSSNGKTAEEQRNSGATANRQIKISTTGYIKVKKDIIQFRDE